MPIVRHLLSSNLVISSKISEIYEAPQGVVLNLQVIQSSFSQTHNIGNNGNMGIRGFTTWEKNSNKCYPIEHWT